MLKKAKTAASHCCHSICAYACGRMEINVKRLLILDSNSILNRAYYGVSPLSTRTGIPTNAVYGFINILIKLIDDYKPDYLCAAFDLKAPTFRHKLYDGYKAQRKPMPDELAKQMPIAKELIAVMNVPILQLEGYEADDIIGTVSRICGENDIECCIATGDKDDLQLVSPSTKVILTVSKYGRAETTVYDEAAVKERYGVTPKEFIDVKALMGDPSDNIPGVAGIGEKGAVSIISQFHSIEYIYEHIEETGIKGRKLEKLEAGKDMAFLSKTLAAIDLNTPIEFNIDECGFDGIKSDNRALYELLNSLELKTAIKKFKLEPPSDAPNLRINEDIFEGTEISEIKTADELKTVLDSLSEIELVPVFSGNTLTAAAFSSGRKAYYTSLSITGGDLINAVKDCFENSKVKKTVNNIKDAMVKPGISLNGIAFDTAIAAYLIDPARKDFTLTALAEAYLGVTLEASEKNQLSLFEDESEDLTIYAKQALALKPMRELLAEQISKNGQERLYYEVELPLISVLARMQIYGFRLDIEELKRFSEMLSDRIAGIEKKIYELAGHEFNINSPKQLGVVLFDELELKPAKKTKTGYSTNVDALDKIKDKHPIVNMVLEYRQYAKLKGTYCDGMSMLINPKTHKIHSEFNQTVTVTGRLSSENPNMQNIPTRTELGRELRKMFAAEEGYVLVDADYSQIELRVLAHLANDETMIEAFKSGEDIHAVTASQVFGVPLAEVTKSQRSHAKAVNFGIVYGIGEFSLSQDIGVSVKEAKDYINSYLEKYHGVREYMEKTKADAKEKGYVTTMMNRIRYIPELKSSNFNLRSFGERAAMNTPVQGSAADIIKLAMVRVDERLRCEKLRSRLILQVHDELIVEAHADEVDEVKKILKEEMENAVQLRVPLVVDMSVGHSWFDAK